MSQPTWFALFDGSSEDGMGHGEFVKRTTDKAEAERHYRKCKKNPYSTGYVVIITDDEYEHADQWTEWSKLPGCQATSGS